MLVAASLDASTKEKEKKMGIFKNTWTENLLRSKSIKETHDHKGQSCDEAHPNMSHKEWEDSLHADGECPTCEDFTEVVK